MPCCIAILHYVQCSHCTLFKLGCTDEECDDNRLCPLEKQHTLLLAKYTWTCETCLTRRFSAEDVDEMDEHLDRRIALLQKVQKVEKWTYIYAEAIFELLHSHQGREDVQKHNSVLPPQQEDAEAPEVEDDVTMDKDAPQEGQDLQRNAVQDEDEQTGALLRVSKEELELELKEMRAKRQLDITIVLDASNRSN